MGDMQEDLIERLTAVYMDAYRAGAHPENRPNAAHYIAAYPGVAEELLAFFVYFHCIAVDLPDPDPTPVTPMPDAAKRALARYRRARTAEMN